MTVAPETSVMGTMFAIRWRLTVCAVELALRVMLVAAIFRRPRRD